MIVRNCSCFDFALQVDSLAGNGSSNAEDYMELTLCAHDSTSMVVSMFLRSRCTTGMNGLQKIAMRSTQNSPTCLVRVWYPECER